jgi:hypothetical protein
MTPKLDVAGSIPVGQFLNERNGLWLLKNSLTGKWPKKLCIRKPYKRLSPFG